MRKLKRIGSYIEILGLFNFMDYAAQRWIQKKDIIKFNVKGLKHPVHLRNGTTDIVVFTDVFIDKEHEKTIQGDIANIVDCGANIGLASLYFLNKYPGAHLVAIEPESSNYEILRKNIEPYSNTKLLKRGVWKRSCYLNIVDNLDGNHAFSVEESESETELLAISIPDLIEMFDSRYIDLIKIDIEGAEEVVFDKKEDWFKRLDNIFLEIHESKKPGITNRIVSLLSQEFTVSKTKEYHHFQRIKNSSN